MSTAAEHDRFNQDVAAHALGALEEHEVAALQGHLEICPVCREEMTAMSAAAHALAVTAPPVAPPDALRDRVMATVRTEAQLLRAAGTDAPAAPVRRARRRFAWNLRPAGALASAAAMAAGVAIGAVALGGGSPGAPARAASVDSSSLPGATASLARSGQGVELRVANLAPPPRGRVYEVWLKRSGQAPQPSSLFALSSGSVRVAGDMHGVTAVLVTSEPVGGSQVPTRQPVIVARPV